jgi:hypothetical protein
VKTDGRISELAFTCVRKVSDHVTPLRPPVVRGVWSGYALGPRDMHPCGNTTLYEGLIACKHGSAALLSAQTRNPALLPDYTPREAGLLTLRASKTLPGRIKPHIPRCREVRPCCPGRAARRRPLATVLARVTPPWCTLGLACAPAVTRLGFQGWPRHTSRMTHGATPPYHKTDIAV